MTIQEASHYGVDNLPFEVGNHRNVALFKHPIPFGSETHEHKLPTGGLRTADNINQLSADQPKQSVLINQVSALDCL